MSTAPLAPVPMPCPDGVDFLAGGIGQVIFHRAQGSGPLCGHAIYAEGLKRPQEKMPEGRQGGLHLRPSSSTPSRAMAASAAAYAPPKSGLLAGEAQVILDATGDADPSCMADTPGMRGASRTP